MVVCFELKRSAKVKGTFRFSEWMRRVNEFPECGAKIFETASVKC